MMKKNMSFEIASDDVIILNLPFLFLFFNLLFTSAFSTQWKQIMMEIKN
jgi:hypothetical protein